jgi:hypothetical protein
MVRNRGEFLLREEAIYVTSIHTYRKTAADPDGS